MNKIIIIIIIGSLLSACNVTKRLPAGETLYTGASLTIKGDGMKKKQRKAIKSELSDMIRPKPNTSILGIRYKLWVYQVVGTPKKKKGIRNWLRNKVGEPPVLASSVNLKTNVDLLTNRLENTGYFSAIATGDTVTKGKKTHANYTATPGVQYKIRKVVLPADTGDIIQKNDKRFSRRSLLKTGNPYNLDVIKAERERIDARLKQRGYYYFNPDYLLLRVDSTVGNNEVDIFLVIKPDAPPKALTKYYINNIYIYPNFTLGLDTLNKETNAVLNRVKDKEFYIIDPKNSYKPRIFERAMFFNKGDVYNRVDHNLTLNRMINIGTFKFVKNRFQELYINDSSKLDAYYYLTPLKGKSLRTELTGKTNTAGFAGTELAISWRNRNTFRAAELLTIKATGGLDFQISGQNKGYNIYNLGGEINLNWPRFLPLNIKGGSAYVPHTKLLLGYDWQKRMKLYTLHTVRASFGYIWKENLYTEHEFNPFNVTYVNSNNVTQEYRDQILKDTTLAKVIEEQLIMGPTYSYTYDNTTNQRPKNTFRFNGKLDLAGNILGLVQGASVKNGDPKTLFDVQYSQYSKMELELWHHNKLGKNNQWANRLYVGVGLPYGNSRELPFIKQFYSGGTNGLRGFRARTLGPGTFRPVVDEGDFIPDQTGDLKLEMNTELRVKLISIVNLGFFVDAGNIWLKNKSEYKPGAEFTSKFLSQLAVDGGIGFRFDLKILVLRTDFAIPFRKPWLPDGNRWVFDKIAFASGPWRGENLVFNLSIGMPF